MERCRIDCGLRGIGRYRDEERRRARVICAIDERVDGGAFHHVGDGENGPCHRADGLGRRRADLDIGDAGLRGILPDKCLGKRRVLGCRHRRADINDGR